MNYVWGLDLVRFAASLVVLLFHLGWKRAVPGAGLDGGWVGVEIFFVISGFVIIGTAQRSSPLEFVERRIARLYPAAIACALINFIVLREAGDAALQEGVGVTSGLPDLFRSMTMIHGPFLTSALWTIPIELGFYALITLIISRRWLDRIDRVAAALCLWSGLYIVPFALGQFGLIGVHVPSLGYGALNPTLLRHGCFFGLGMLIWLAQRTPPRPWQLAAMAIGATLGAAEIAARAHELLPDYGHPVALPRLIAQALGLYAAAIAAIVLLARANARVTLGPRLKHVARTLGLMTYPVYLMHEAVGGVTLGLLERAGLAQPPALALAISASLAASYVVVTRLEPALRQWLITAMGWASDRTIRARSITRATTLP